MGATMTGSPKKPWDGDDPYLPPRAVMGALPASIPMPALLALYALAGLPRFNSP